MHKNHTHTKKTINESQRLDLVAINFTYYRQFSTGYIYGIAHRHFFFEKIAKNEIGGDEMISFSVHKF